MVRHLDSRHVNVAIKLQGIRQHFKFHVLDVYNHTTMIYAICAQRMSLSGRISLHVLRWPVLFPMQWMMYAVAIVTMSGEEVSEIIGIRVVVIDFIHKIE